MLSTTIRSLTRAGRRMGITAASKPHKNNWRQQPPSLRISAAFCSTDLSSSCWRQDQDERKRRSAAALYLHTMPRISVQQLPVVSSSTSLQTRWLSTTTPPTTTLASSKEEDSTTLDSANHDAKLNNNNDPETAKNTMRQKLRARIQDSKDKAMHRADGYRDSAVGHYRDFREHPRQSAQEGAKNVTGMLKKYGPVFVGTYLSVYFSTLGILFAGVQSGVLDPVVLFGWMGQGGDSETTTTAASTVHLVVEFMENHDFTKPYSGIIERNPVFANLAVAWIAVKFTEPIRLGVALAITPRVSRFLGYTKEADDDDDDEVVPTMPEGTEKCNDEDSTTTTTSSTSTSGRVSTNDEASPAAGNKPK